jgi:hypothetical protein
MTDSVSETDIVPAATTDGAKHFEADCVAAHCVGANMRRAIVEIDSIKIGENFGRTENDEIVDKFAMILPRLGVRGRIELAPDHTLLTGYYWLAAAKKIRWKHIEVSIVTEA